ncbi:MAG: helix-turn-helix domain-containing protein [Rhodanobacter sp.]
MNSSAAEADAPSFGSRLRAARGARNLSLEACATALKLPARVLRQLEGDCFEGSDSEIYLASYVTKYGRYVGINEASVEVELARLRQIEPTLVATGGISHSRFLFDRYATAATYLVLTLVIAVPTIWFGVRSTLDRDLSYLAPLDAAPVNQATTHLGAATPPVLVDRPASTPSVATDSQDQPLMASMAPFPNLTGGDSLVPSKPAVPVVPVVSGDHDGHTLKLTLKAASWVEVVQTDGTRLEYGLLPAGSSKTYRSNQPLDVNIGNVSGAQVDIDGQAVGMDDFRHANVAHFRMQLQNGKASAASL